MENMGKENTLVMEACEKTCTVLRSGDSRRVCQVGFSMLCVEGASPEPLCPEAAPSVPMHICPMPWTGQGIL